MKKVKLSLILLFATMLIQEIKPTNVSAAPPQASVSFQFFYDELTPYGNWISNPQYGYVWVPNARPGFRPYLTNGHWVFTDDGWMWASNYDWGWAPFHYGSWMLDPEFGWVWVPGYSWAPAWVTWANYDEYYGWAPIGPGFSFTVTNYYPPIDYWCFMHPRYMTYESYNDHYYVAHDRRIVLENNTRVIENINNVTVVNNVTRKNDVAFNAGPRRTEFENTAHTKLQSVAVREADKPGKVAENSSNEVTVFRPKVNKETSATEKPKKIATPEELKQVRNSGDNKNDVQPKSNISQQHPVQQSPAGKGDVKKPDLQPRSNQDINKKEMNDRNNSDQHGTKTDVAPPRNVPRPEPPQQKPERQQVTPPVRNENQSQHPASVNPQRPANTEPKQPPAKVQPPHGHERIKAMQAPRQHVEPRNEPMQSAPHPEENKNRKDN